MRYYGAPIVWSATALIPIFGGIAAAQHAQVVDAAEQRAPALVSTRLKEGADVNARQPDGATALHWAAHWDDIPMAVELLRAGADPNATNDFGVSPLFLAAENGRAPMITTLLQNSANPNAALPSGETALMTAARTGDVAAVETLLHAGAAMDAAQASRGQTALMWAIVEHHVEVARALIERGANVAARTKEGFTPLLFAAREGDIATVRQLLATGVDVNESSPKGVTPLLAATARGHVDLALFLLEQGAGPEGNIELAGYTPLHWAVTTFETTPITYPELPVPGEWAAMSGIPDRKAKFALIKALLARGADVNARTTAPLLNQAPVGGGSFKSSPGVGVTPFFAATASADAEVMRLLVAHGADPLVTSPNGETPLMIAIAADIEISFRLNEAKRLEAVRLALELGNDLEAAETNRGHRAMHLAARGGFHDIITFLAQQGADLNSKTYSRTETGYGTSTRTVEPQTPLGLVEGSIYSSLFLERPETAEFLRKLGAKSEGRFFPLADLVK